MDKNRAQIEIELLFWGKEEKSTEEIRVRLTDILEEMQTYNFYWSKRQGMFKAVNVLTELAEEEARRTKEL